MKLVVLDGYTVNPGDNSWDEIAALGEVVVYDRTPPAEVVERAAYAEVVITNKTRLPASVIERLPSLRLISVLATGFDVVDCTAARAHDVVVSNVPHYATEAVAQHTLALLLELCQRVGEHDRAVRDGRWSRSPDFCFWTQAPVELAGLTAGIVGFGRIGRRVGELAHALGMKVIASARTRSDAPSYDGFAWADTAEIFARADVVSLHCPLTPDTAGLVGVDMLARAKAGALLINTARGGLVDHEALAAALHEGRIGGAAVDVLAGEPPAPDDPLLAAPHCIVTPHMAWASLAARRRLVETTAANVRAFLEGRPINVVS